MDNPYYASNGFYPQQYETQSVVASDIYRHFLGDLHDNSDSSEEWYETGDNYDSSSAQSPAVVDYVGCSLLTENSGGPHYGGYIHKYTDPESIREFLNLHSMLPFIQPARLRGSIFGPTLDLVEEQTGQKFAIAVPKKMLVLFCGRRIINRFLRTLEREDNKNWRGGPVKQELRFPPNYTNHIGVKIIIAWMNQACHKNLSEMKSIRVPKNLFAALSLSRALTAFGLHRDANRVDGYIATHHYKRPLYLNEMISIWNCLPKDSKYTYRMIEDLRKQRCRYEKGNKRALPDAEKVLEFLEQNHELKARVDDPDYNIEPSFRTEWCARAALRTQRMLAAMNGLQGDNTLVDTNNDIQIAANDTKGYGRQAFQQRKASFQSTQRRHQQKDQPNIQKVISLSDWRPQAPPIAWPEFDKTVVLKILDIREPTPAHNTDRNDSAHGGDGGSLQW